VSGKVDKEDQVTLEQQSFVYDWIGHISRLPSS